MTTSDESWSNKLRQIGDIERPDHYYLTEQHECVYFGEYTARKGWSHSKTNGTIHNLKKHPDTRHTMQWQHKLRTINWIGRLIRANLDPAALSRITFVPAPPSRPPTDAAYDDRMLQVCKAVGNDVDVRELLETAVHRPAAHESEERPGPEGLAQCIRFRQDQANLRPVADQIIIVDDVMVTGATFVACSQIIVEHHPGASIFGMFVARRVPERTLAIDEFDVWDF
ncbi:hypothetical protein [Nitratireductor sp. XY-223]|uniref:phosphoribosyltransferase n=1 Tax=Nitratireductor sp. XY-223 TaxID=2561926 RepID=UPI0010AA8793|nr:hypothetical protein [Nitratireductor sp. XY-223]